MLIMDKISTLLKDCGKTQKDLMDYLGLEKSTFTAWKSGKNTSYKKYLSEISDYFNVSVDYLLGRTNDFIRYEETEENLNAPSDVNEYFNGDAKKIYEFQKIVEHDAQSEDIPETPKLRSIARLENSSFTPDEDDEILNFIKYIESKRNGGE